MTPGVVYAVSQWASTFETGESRKYKRLTWIAERTDFNSTGWQQGLDEFGPEKWLQVYGCWMVVCRVAATAKVRGRLGGDNGEPFSAARIARPAGVSPQLIEECIQWAVKVGWLVPDGTSPGDSPGDLPERREILPDGPENTRPTEQNGTEQNPTERNGTEHDSEPIRAESFESRQTAAIVRPSRVPFSKFVERSELLQALAKHPVQPSGSEMLGSVFGRDQLRPDMITNISGHEKDWLTWYQRQLAADSPALTAGNQAEACLVLALVYAARRIPDESVRKCRLAIVISQIQQRDAASITAGDIKRAARVVSEFFGTVRSSVEHPTSAAETVPPKRRCTKSVVKALANLRSSQQQVSSTQEKQTCHQ